MPVKRLLLDSRYRYGVLGLGVLLVVLAWWLPQGAPSAGLVPVEVLLATLGFGALGAAYGSRSGRGLGLGAVALPPLLHFVGSRFAAPAALAFLAIASLISVGRSPSHARAGGALGRGSGAGERPSDEWAELLGVRLIAVIVAGVAWLAVFAPKGDSVFRAGLAAGGFYFLVIAIAEVIRWSTGDRELRQDAFNRDLAYEIGAWLVGVLSVVVFLGSGRGAGIGLLGAVAVLALELARLDRERGVAIEGAHAMQEVHLAGHRIIFGESEPLAIARQIFGECRRLVTFSWFQLALLDANGEEQSWFSGPDGWVREGEPEPPPRPAALPGIHRRVSWQIVERELAVPGRRLGVIRMWCDPRQQRPGATGWLDALLPQMASSVHSVVLDREARQDPLTGLADRRALEERLLNVYGQAVESGQPMAVIMCDLDKFKRINDLYGHATGDQALMAVAAVLEGHRREKDLCCRYGGEEFAVVLEETEGHTALQVAERLREAVESLAFKPHGRRIKLQLSAGVAAFPELHVKEAGTLLELADEALYKAKKSGRNRCLLALGSASFETVDGEIMSATDKPAQPSIPTLFA
ncbi:MAG: GGDEF domain-containing protein [bacterium]|nr:GGDEF domain-containing protein [bacterium]